MSYIDKYQIIPHEFEFAKTITNFQISFMIILDLSGKSFKFFYKRGNVQDQ